MILKVPEKFSGIFYLLACAIASSLYTLILEKTFACREERAVYIYSQNDTFTKNCVAFEYTDCYNHYRKNLFKSSRLYSVLENL